VLSRDDFRVGLVEQRSRVEPGFRLDRYELLCPIAHGGMASVWLARLHGKHGFEKLVAIKTILPQFAADERFQQMFLDEARIASGIEHPNTAQILDLGEQHDILYIVMEWVDGDSLSKLHRAVQRRGLKIPPGIILRILADTCGGLEAAHDLRDKSGKLLGVVHRDVSPQNILVNSKGNAKLIDFGIVKALDRVSAETSSGLLKGKIQYMAPEQAIGKRVDRRSDVWALGAVLYFLLTGDPPFEGENPLATLHLLTTPGAPPPLPGDVPLPVQELVRRTLEKDPDNRVATAADMQKAIESAMIEAKIQTSTSDVAAFVAEHLTERAEARKKAVSLALEAAAERGRIHKLLAPAPSDSSSGTDHLATRREAWIPDSSPGLAGAEAPVSQVSQVSHVSHASQESQLSHQTLGSAAVAYPPPAPGRGVDKRIFAVAAGVMGAMTIVAVIAAAAYLRKSSGISSAQTTSATEPPRQPDVQLGAQTTAPLATQPSAEPMPLAFPPATTRVLSDVPPAASAAKSPAPPGAKPVVKTNVAPPVRPVPRPASSTKKGTDYGF
jgi:serine/threonine protein kinase